jgi:hypothetical protein
MEKNFEIILQEGLQMIELEERLEMVQLVADVADGSCCFDSNTNDKVEVPVEM